MTKVSELLGAKNDSKTRTALQDIINFEKELANITIPSEERRDDEKLYHAKNISQLQELSPVVSLKFL
jgi:endothelin-converting enzyme